MIRALLVAVCVAFVLVLLLGMRLGWHNRMRRQSFLPSLPARPAELGEPRLAATGLYVGTTFANSWQDRVVHESLGIRADADARLHDVGLLIERSGAEAIFVPAGSFLEARLAAGLAGTVTGAGGLLVVRWRLGGSELDTAFRADDKTTYPQWLRMINERVGTP